MKPSVFLLQEPGNLLNLSFLGSQTPACLTIRTRQWKVSGVHVFPVHQVNTKVQLYVKVNTYKDVI